MEGFESLLIAVAIADYTKVFAFNYLSKIKYDTRTGLNLNQKKSSIIMDARYMYTKKKRVVGSSCDS